MFFYSGVILNLKQPQPIIAAEKKHSFEGEIKKETYLTMYPLQPDFLTRLQNLIEEFHYLQ